MSAASEQMEKMTLQEIHDTPCKFCYACNWSKKHDCYEGNHAQCSICAIILAVIAKMGKTI